MTKPKAKYYRYLVTVLKVPGVNSLWMAQYITDAVRCWAGGFEPADGGDHGDGTFGNGNPLGPPCILREPGNVTVTRHRRRRKYVKSATKAT